MKLWGSKLHGIEATFVTYHAILCYNWLVTQSNKLITLVQKVSNWEKKLITIQILVNLDRLIFPWYIEVMGIHKTYNQSYLGQLLCNYLLQLVGNSIKKLVTLVQKVSNKEKKLVTSRVSINLQKPIILCYIEVMGI